MTATAEQHQIDDVRVGKVLISFTDLTVKSAQHTSQVEFRVMRVLETLIRHEGKLVTREELHREVWQDVHVSDDTLNRAISILRQKLAACGAENVITTIPRRGYRFDGKVSRGEQTFPPEQPQDQRRKSLLIGLVAAGLVMVPAMGFAATRVVTGSHMTEPANSEAILGPASVNNAPVDDRSIRMIIQPLTQRGLPVDELVSALVNMQSLDEAVRMMRAHQDTRLAQLDTFEYVEYLHQLGALVYERDIDAAISIYGEIMRLKPDDGFAATRLARSYARRGNIESAVSAISDAMAYDTLDARDRIALQVEQVKADNSEFAEKAEALKFIEREAELLGFDDVQASARLLRVNYEWIASSDAQALNEAQIDNWIAELVSVSSILRDEKQDAELAVSDLTLGLMHKLKGELDQAVELFKGALEVEKHLDRTHNVHAVLTNLAMTEFERQNFAAARTFNTEAIQTVRSADLPADLQWNWMLGAEIALADGNQEEGCRLFSVARQSWPRERPFSPEYQDLHRRLGCGDSLALLE